VTTPPPKPRGGRTASASQTQTTSASDPPITGAKYTPNRGRATGPHTLAGKQASRLNALRHGLASAQAIDPEEIQKLAKLICNEPARRSEALTVADCILMLRRVRQARLQVLARQPLPLVIAELERLDRYERRAHSRMLRAVREISF
jgi:glutathione S-transferase